MSSQVFAALGIFGRLDALQEARFLSMQQQYQPLNETSEAFSVFPHLTLVAGFEVPAAKLSIYAELLKKLQEQLPVTVTTNGVQTVNGHDIALSFDNAQTLKLRELASSKLPQQVVETGYFTVVREVHEKFHRELLAELQDVNSLTFTDFTLCANRVDDSHVLHTSSEF